MVELNKKSAPGNGTRSRTALSFLAATLLLGGGITEASAKSHRHHHRHHHHAHHANHTGNSSWRDANASVGGMASTRASGRRYTWPARLDAVTTMLSAKRASLVASETTLSPSCRIVWTLNDRNPGFGHDTMITYMYMIAFKSSLRDVGLAAALGVVNVALILVAVIVYLRTVRWREEDA